MKCSFCGHDTHGPWPYCDATCEMDHADEIEAQNAPDEAVEPGNDNCADYVDAYTIDLDM